MHEPHFSESAALGLPLEEVTPNLVDNLHLRWSYGLLYLDRYSDEDDRPISVIYGIHKYGDSELFHLRVTLSATKSNNTALATEIWHVQTQGWPVVDNQGQPMLGNNPADAHLQKFRKISADVVKFSQTPHGAGGGIFDAIRRAFVKNTRQRKYRR